MLKYNATNDRKLLDELSGKIFGKAYEKQVGFVLYDNDKPIGLARMTVTETISVLEEVGIVEEARKKGNGDFFTRSLIWGLANVSETVEIGGVRPYFEKFGFREEGGVMRCPSDKITFPRDCHK